MYNSPDLLPGCFLTFDITTTNNNKPHLTHYKKLEYIKIIDMGIIITYNKSAKNHTIFSTERSDSYVSCKEHGC